MYETKNFTAQCCFIQKLVETLLSELWVTTVIFNISLRQILSWGDTLNIIWFKVLQISTILFTDIQHKGTYIPIFSLIYM